jgi:hypothetical protein
MTLHLTPAQARTLQLAPSSQRKIPVAPKEERTYHGILYDSKGESDFAAQCDLRKADGELVDWAYHPPPYALDIRGYEVGRYTMDFALYYADGRKKLIEVKGAYWTPRDRLRWKVFLACWQDQLREMGWTITLVQKPQTPRRRRHV